ncbi:MAG: hypothetical protein JNL21_34410 [Myxococcales bacterium]|nr:hypothetical protein [Myxococcales bacterium]
MTRWVAPLCLFAAACGSAPAKPAETEAVKALDARSCARAGSHTIPRPAGAERRGSAVALARVGGELYAYVADADSRAIHTVAVGGRRALGRTELDGAPREILVLPDGRIAVTLADKNRVLVLEPGAEPSEPIAPLCAREVPAEPWGIAASQDDNSVVVTSAFAGALTVLDGSSFTPTRVVALPRDPRGVLVDGSGQAWVSHLVGGVVSRVDVSAAGVPTRIDMSTKKVAPTTTQGEAEVARVGVQGYALASVVVEPRRGGETAAPRLRGSAPPEPEKPDAPSGRERIIVPQVSVDPGSPDRPLGGYYGSEPLDGVPKQAPVVRVLEAASGRPLTDAVLATSEARYTRECLLPRAIAPRQRAGTALIACLGIDSILEVDVRVPDPMRAERRRFEVAAGPVGVAVDDVTDTAVVFSQFAGEIAVIDLARDADEGTTAIALDYAPAPEVAASAEGRLLFYRTDDLRVAVDGMGCASCHPDGRDDALSWMTPEGPRQTLMLAGRTRHTAPYGWTGREGELETYVATTVKRLGGVGLDKEEAASLARFIERAPAPAPRNPDERVARGREIFFGAEQGCGACHPAGGTDGRSHALDGGQPTEAFDTPSLRFVSGTGPYFHDGRYATLEALLSDPRSKMGRPDLLTPEDRGALAAFLRSL